MCETQDRHVEFSFLPVDRKEHHSSCQDIGDVDFSWSETSGGSRIENHLLIDQVTHNNNLNLSMFQDIPCNKSIASNSRLLSEAIAF